MNHEGFVRCGAMSSLIDWLSDFYTAKRNPYFRLSDSDRNKLGMRTVVFFVVVGTTPAQDSGIGGPDLPSGYVPVASSSNAKRSGSWLHQYSRSGIVPRSVNRDTLNPSSMSLSQRTRS
jgi:hypothetical protein